MDSKVAPVTAPPSHSKRSLIAWIFFITLSLVSIQAWAAVYQAVLVPGGSNFFVPLLWFSLVIVFFSLECIFVNTRLLQYLSIGTAFLPSLFFARSFAHIIFMGLGMVSAYLALRMVRQEVAERVHFSVRKSLLAGIPTFLFALVLVMSSQYYVHAQSLSWEQLIPSFSLSERNTAHILRLAGGVYPPFQELDDKEVTVDEFLRTLGSQSTFSMDGSILGTLGISATDMKATLEEAAMAEKRKSLGQFLGRPVRGDEKMNIVLTEVLRSKLLRVVESTEVKVDRLPVPVIPMVLAVLLFLSVYPIATLFVSFFTLVAEIIFGVLYRLHLITFRRIPVEQDQLAP